MECATFSESRNTTGKLNGWNVVVSLDSVWHFPYGAAFQTPIQYWENSVSGYAGLIVDRTERLAEGVVTSVTDTTLSFEWSKAVARDNSGVLARSQITDLPAAQDFSGVTQSGSLDAPKDMVDLLSSIQTGVYVVVIQSHTSTGDEDLFSVSTLGGDMFALAGRARSRVGTLAEKIRELRGLAPETEVRICAENGKLLSTDDVPADDVSADT
mmetsp:Transcript_125718/g.222802  ORF Transcript_125718/g.222802 Transcript_125718/m.222802 type:complete len:212 (-) Transcript_125718:42-677(-)